MPDRSTLSAASTLRRIRRRQAGSSERNRISESNHVTWSNSRLISQPRRVRGARPLVTAAQPLMTTPCATPNSTKCQALPCHRPKMAITSRITANSAQFCRFRPRTRRKTITASVS